MDIKKWAEHWDAGFDKYSSINQTPSSFGLKSLDYMKKYDLGNVLEIGIGTGRDTSLFYSHGLKITALDVAAKMLQAAKKNMPKISVLNEDAKAGIRSFQKNSFDSVYARLSLHYFDNVDTKQIFEDIYDVLSKDGFLFVEVNSINSHKYGRWKPLSKYITENSYGGISHYFDEAHLRGFIDINKFKIIELEEISSPNSEGSEDITYILVAQKL